MNTIFGAVINENLNDEIIVTVIATGFDDDKNNQTKSLRSERIIESAKSVVDDDSNDSEDIIPSFLRRRGI